MKMGLLPRRHRPDLDNALTLASPDARTIAHAIQSRLSALLLLPRLQRKRGFIVSGTGRVAQICLEVLRDVGLNVVAFTSQDNDTSLLCGLPIISMDAAIAMKPAAILFSDEPTTEISRVPASIKALYLLEGGEDSVDAPYLISGDQDEFFESERIAKLMNAPWESPWITQANLLKNTGFHDWTEEKAPQLWSFGGGPHASAAKEASGPIGDSALLKFSACTTYLVQRHVCQNGLQQRTVLLGCWVRCDRPGIARLQLTDAMRDISSNPHPGDNTWRYLSLVREPSEEIDFLDAYLQVLDEGCAAFNGPTLAWISTGPLC